MVMFRDRKHAGQELAQKLLEFEDRDVVVLGIPRGGVTVALEVARLLHGELGIIVARKIGAPGHDELGIGAVTADGSAWLDDDLVVQTGAKPEYLEREIANQVREARRREEAYDHRHRPRLKGRTVLVVDDGLATGVTVKAAIQAVRQAGAPKVIVAVPVAPREAIREIERLADAVVTVIAATDFHAVGEFYHDFRPVNDEAVRLALQQSQSA
jgi:putative phosphoribosyl transferase